MDATWLVFIKFILLCTILVAGDAWAVQSILFAVQTTNEPGITAGIIAVGGGAVGYYALGAGGIGRYVLAYGGLGRHMFTLNRRDREVVELFRRWVPRLGKYAR